MFLNVPKAFLEKQGDKQQLYLYAQASADSISLDSVKGKAASARQPEKELQSLAPRQPRAGAAELRGSAWGKGHGQSQLPGPRPSPWQLQLAAPGKEPPTLSDVPIKVKASQGGEEALLTD